MNLERKDWINDGIIVTALRTELRSVKFKMILPTWMKFS